MFRPQTQSAPGYGRKALSTAPVVPGLEDVIASDDPLSARKLPLGAYSVRPSVDYYKTQLATAKVTSGAIPFPSKPMSLQQAWANAEDENRKVSAALRRASPLVPEIVLFKQIYGPKLPSLSDNIALAGDAITAAALAVVNKNSGIPLPTGAAPDYDPEDQPAGSGVPPATSTQPAGSGVPPATSTQPAGTGVPPATSTQPAGTGMPPATSTQPAGTGVPSGGVLPPGGAPQYDPEETPGGVNPVTNPPAGTVPPTTNPVSGVVIPVVTKPITVPIPGQIDTSDPAAAAAAIAATEASATVSGIAAPTLTERAQLDDNVYGYPTIPVTVPRTDMQVVASAMVRANRVLYDGANPSEAYKFVQAVGIVGTYTALHTTKSLRATALFQYVSSNAPMVLNLGEFVPPAVSDWLYVETAYVLLQRYDSTKTTSNTPDEVTAAMAYAKVQILGYYSNKVLMGLHALLWKGMPGDEAFLTQAINIAKQLPPRGNAQVAALQYMASYVESSAIAHAIITARDRSQFTSSMINFLGFFAQTATTIESGIKTLSSLLGAVFLTGDMVTRGRTAIYDFLRQPSGAASTLLQFVGSAYFAQNRLFTWACLIATNYGMMSGYRMAAYLIWRALFGMARQGHIVNANNMDDPEQLVEVRAILADMGREVAANPDLARFATDALSAFDAGLNEGLEPTQLIEDAPDVDQGRLSIVAPNTLLFIRRMEFLGNLAMSTAKTKDREDAKEALREILAYWNVPEGTIETILTEMSSLSTAFQFVKLDAAGFTVISSPTLLTYLETNAEAIHRLMIREIGSRPTVLGLMGNFARPFVAAKSNMAFWSRFASIIGILFGATASQVNTIPEDDKGEILTKPSTPAQAAAPPPAPARVEGGATMTPVATPQFTDAPSTVTLEAAMSQLADRTLSVQQVTRSGLPDSYSWYLIKARRRTLRALFFAVFTGLGATPADATQVLNFMTPTFVDVSLNTQEYSGLRIQGRHGSYPRLDAFFLKYFDTFSKYFAGLSSAIRVSYASTIATRIFGSRGKSYFQKLFALSAPELAQVAKNSREVLDIVTGDTTFSDSTPQGPPPTTEQARGYGTGPYDYSYP